MFTPRSPAADGRPSGGRRFAAAGPVRRWPRAALAACMVVLLFGCAPPAEPRPALPTRAAIDGNFFVTTDGLALPVRRWPATQSPKAVLVALHGVNDYSQSFDEAARYFAAAGVSTVAYDQRGFGYAPDRGRWPGTRALTGDLLEFLALVRRQHPGLPLFVLGESMGGAVAAVALTESPETEVDGVMLLTPAVWTRDAMPWYQRFGIWIGALTTPGLRLSGATFNFAPSDNPDVMRRQAQDPGVINGTRMDNLSGLTDLMDAAAPAIAGLKPRCLLLYGLRDQMMPRRPMISLLERWPPGASANFRYALYPEGHHTLLRDLQRQRVWNDVLSWLLRPDRALPSGFERQRAELLPLLRAGG